MGPRSGRTPYPPTVLHVSSGSPARRVWMPAQPVSSTCWPSSLAADGRRRAWTESTVARYPARTPTSRRHRSCAPGDRCCDVGLDGRVGALPGAGTRTSRRAPPGAPGTALIRCRWRQPPRVRGRENSDVELDPTAAGGGVDHEWRTGGVRDLGARSWVLRTQTPHVGGRYRRDMGVGMLDVGATVVVFPHTCENVVR
jgi:hypothetical protein